MIINSIFNKFTFPPKVYESFCLHVPSLTAGQIIEYNFFYFKGLNNHVPFFFFSNTALFFFSSTYWLIFNCKLYISFYLFGYNLICIDLNQCKYERFFFWFIRVLYILDEICRMVLIGQKQLNIHNFIWYNLNYVPYIGCQYVPSLPFVLFYHVF